MILKDGEHKCSSEEGIAKGERKMFRVSDEAGTLSVLEIAEGDKVKKELLTDDDVYIINTGELLSR